MKATEPRTPAIIVEDQATASFMFLWSSWRPDPRNEWNAHISKYDSIPKEWTYVDPNIAGIDVHPILKGEQ